MAIEIEPIAKSPSGTKPTAAVSKTALWTGRIISTLIVLVFTASAAGKFQKSAELTEGFGHLGWPLGLAVSLGILELACALLYAIPRTSILGAVLLTGYLGGAIATHVRVGDLVFVHALLGILVWGGLYLRDARLRVLLPLRRAPSQDGAHGMSLLITIGVWFVAIVATFAILVALQPGEFRIVRSATIDAAPSDVFAQVNDFHGWDAWSPWAKLDPAAKNTFEGPSAGKGAIFKWSGNDQVGEGQMTLLESRPNELIRIKLDFIRPFPSTCDVEFTFKPAGQQTGVTWTMAGAKDYMSKAFCMFMNMDKMIGGDFERGLAQMKAVAEAAAKK